ncbi:argininosuccinate lyase [Buchnera aphidicola]|uniref:argininosuccinate lyase n=1 Tax=Buchnera aphidicola TaxID=9 RepID=UPI0030EE967A
MSLWGGRFKKKSNFFFSKFNNSLKFDYFLIKFDIIASIAWSKILCSSKIITKSEQIKLENALNILLKETKENPKKIFLSHAEDIHSWVEEQLINMIGDLGKKLHSGRSRNDQVSTDLKLWCKYQINKIKKLILKFQNKLLNLAENHISSYVSGYTHLQNAQPISFAHWFLAYFEMFKRDFQRLDDCLSRLDISPLGSGALSGTAGNINRDKLAKLMNFKESTENSLDSVSDRDYVIELLSSASISMMHLSRFSEDLIFFNSGELNFIELSDLVTSGSSLMPQKKNPDALELIRGKTSGVYGSLISLLVLLKALPLAYNKDLQEDKEHLFKSINVWKDCIQMSIIVLKNLKINHKICKISAMKGYSNSTDLADYLVSKKIAFRSAHDIVGKIVLYAISKNKSLEELNLVQLKKYSSVISKDVYEYISLNSCIKKRNSKGGTSKFQVLKAIKRAKKYLKSYY